MFRGGFPLPRAHAASTYAAVLAAAGCVLVSGCDRESLEAICPEVAPGELIVTELRGPQDEDDALGQWVEMFNDSGVEQDLRGLRVEFRDLFGEPDGAVIVRDPGVLVGPNGYAVLGGFSPDRAPAHVDYGYADDFDENLKSGGIIELRACGQLIDRIVYGRDANTQLPDPGTLTLDGALAPDADRNDEDSAWCVDAREDPANPTGPRPGTPGDTNTICAP